MKKHCLALLTFTLLLIGARPYETPIPVPPPTWPVQLAVRKAPEPERIDPLPPRHLSEYTPLFERAAERAGIPVDVLEAVAWTESKHNPQALSPERQDGTLDMGLFQFHGGYLSDYAKRYGVFDPMNPTQAARVAAAHLSYLHKRFGAWPAAIEKWNAGTGGANFDYIIKVYGGK